MIGLGAKWGEIPGQQFRNAIDGMIGDTFQYMAQVEFRIEAVELGCSQQSIDRSRAFSAGIGTGEEIVFAA
jgi:hypothetical protein